VVGLRRAVEPSSIPYPLQSAQRVGHPELGFRWEDVALGHPDIQVRELGGTRLAFGVPHSCAESAHEWATRAVVAELGRANTGVSPLRCASVEMTGVGVG